MPLIILLTFYIVMECRVWEVLPYLQGTYCRNCKLYLSTVYSYYFKYHLLTESEVITGKSHTEALMYMY